MDRQLHLNSERTSLAINVNRIHTSKKQGQAICIRRYWSPSNINNCSGFTLMQVAITLMILGFLWSVALKAVEIVDSQRVQKLADDFIKIRQYVSEYQAKYRTLPGDDPSIGTANAHLNTANACTSAITEGCKPGNGTIDGKWNDNTASSESFIFWQHIRLAGFSSGATDITMDSYPEQNIVGGIIGITNQGAAPAAGLKGAYIVCSDGIPGDYVQPIDMAIDDGKTDSGFMMATLAGTAKGGAVIAASAIRDNDLYLVCMGV